MTNIPDTLIHFGGAIKNLGESSTGIKVGGYLVVFDSADASPYRDRFSRDTDFDIEDGDRTSIYYNHGLDGTLKRTRLGSGRLFVTDAGVWFEGEIQKRTDYLREHIEKIGEGLSQTVHVKGREFPMFGLSSGVPAHLVERKALGNGHLITKWPLRTDASITPTPAEPLTACISLKSLIANTYHDSNESHDALEDLEAGLRDGLSLQAHSLKVLDATKEIVKRCAELAQMRCIAQNRRWSEANFENLTNLAQGLESGAESLKRLAQAHIPRGLPQAPLHDEVREALLLETQLVLEEADCASASTI